MKQLLVLICLLISGSSLLKAQEKVDMAVMQQIKDEEKNNSQVELIAHYLTDVCGPRLTNSPGYNRALDTFRRHGDLLWQGLTDGVIDCIVSDHSPCTPELKQLDTGDFGVAWGGIAGLQVALPAVWTQAKARGHGLAELTRWMSAGPAALAGLHRKGALAVGRDADLTVFAPDQQFVVDPTTLHHRNPITAYAGQTLTGTVRSTWLRGQELVGDANRGQLLTRPADRAARESAALPG